MTDLDDAVARHLLDQPPVDVPPLAVVRRRATRRRRRVAGQWTAGAAITALAALLAAPVLDMQRASDVVAGPSADDALVPSDAVFAEVCPAEPYNGGRRHCSSGRSPGFVRELAQLVDAARPATARTACRPQDRDTPNVRLRFVAADGRESRVRVVGCLLTVEGSDRPAVYAPEVARSAAAHLTDWLIPADGSDAEGCTAVVEDLGALARAIPADDSPAPDLALLAQVAEGTMAEERPYLDSAQQEVVDRVRPQINALLLGASQDGTSPPDVIRQGLEELRSSCPAAR